MLHQGIGMPLFAMCYGFFGMFQGFTYMFVLAGWRTRKGEPTEQWETNDKRGNRCKDQYSTMDFQGSSLASC